MKILALICLTFTWVFNANAQSNIIRESSLQLMGGAVNNRMVDSGLSFNRQSFTGTAFKFFAGYIRGRNRNKLMASFEANGGNLHMKDEHVTAQIINGQIACSYLLTTSSYTIFGKKSRLYVGPKISSIINYVNAEKLDNETLLTIYGLYLHAFQQMQLGTSSLLDISIVLPTVCVSKRLILDGGLNEPRNDNLISTLTDDAVFSIGKMAEFEATWSQRLKPQTYFTVRYRFAYSTNTEIQDFKFYSNEILVGFRFYFKHE